MGLPLLKPKMMVAAVPEQAAQSWFSRIAVRLPDLPPASRAAMAELPGLQIRQGLLSREIGTARGAAVAGACSLSLPRPGRQTSAAEYQAGPLSPTTRTEPRPDSPDSSVPDYQSPKLPARNRAPTAQERISPSQIPVRQASSCPAARSPTLRW